MRFDVGNTVRISKQSEYYSEKRDVNPRDINGIITSTDCDSSDGYYIKVKWDNSRINYYTEKDLKLVKR